MTVEWEDCGIGCVLECPLWGLPFNRAISLEKQEVWFENKPHTGLFVLFVGFVVWGVVVFFLDIFLVPVKSVNMLLCSLGTINM